MDKQINKKTTKDMGAGASSKAITATDELHGYTILSRGVYGVTYKKNGSEFVMKRGRTEFREMNVDDPAWRSVRFTKFALQHGDQPEAGMLTAFVSMQVGENLSPVRWQPAVHPHVAENPTFLEAVRKNYALPYEYRLTMTYGGEALEIGSASAASLPMHVRYHLLLQALRIVHFLERSGIVHVDLHYGNFLKNGKILGVYPRLVLIDYDDTFFVGDAPYEKLHHNCLMLSHVSGMMANVPETYSVLDALGVGSPDIEKIVRGVKNFYKDIEPAVNKIVGASGVDPDADIVTTMYLDVLKARNPSLFRQLYGMQATSRASTWFPEEDFWALYNNIRDMHAIIAHFSQRYAQSNKT